MLLNSIRAQAVDLAGYYTEDEQTVAYTIYGEAGGLPYEDKLAVGWTIRDRMDLCSDCSYGDITDPPQFAPRASFESSQCFRASRLVPIFSGGKRGPER